MAQQWPSAAPTFDTHPAGGILTPSYDHMTRKSPTLAKFALCIALVGFAASALPVKATTDNSWVDTQENTTCYNVFGPSVGHALFLDMEQHRNSANSATDGYAFHCYFLAQGGQNFLNSFVQYIMIYFTFIIMLLTAIWTTQLLK